MASYNELIALIDAYINRNGVQAITGQVLNGVLKAMVDQLGRGYTIMGAAQPTDNPGTPDGPESWFASTPGTYTNFGGLTVATAELALLSYTPSDGWEKNTLTQGITQVDATIDANVGTPAVTASYVNGVLTFSFENMKGDTGDAAGFGTVAATVDANIGTPAVSVQTSGPDTAKNMTFAFRNLKGETGVTSVVATVDNTTGNPSCAVSLVGQELHLDFTGLKGAQGDTGVSADYPITIANNLTTNDPTAALSAAQGVVLEGEISQLDLKLLGYQNIWKFEKGGISGGTDSESNSYMRTPSSNPIPITEETTFNFALKGGANDTYNYAYYLYLNGVFVRANGSSPSITDGGSITIPFDNTFNEVRFRIGKSSSWTTTQIENSFVTDGPIPVTPSLIQRVDIIEDELDKLSGLTICNLAKTEYILGSCRGENGADLINTTGKRYRSPYIKVAGLSKIKIHNSGFNVCLYFYDENKAFLSAITPFSSTDIIAYTNGAFYLRYVVAASNTGDVVDLTNVRGKVFITSEFDTTEFYTLTRAKQGGDARTFVAHRGLNVSAPQNTMSAFALAASEGFDAMEFDVRFTSDGVPVILHDGTINATSNGTGAIDSMTLATALTYDFGSWYSPNFAGEKIPTLREVLEFCRKKDVAPWIEMKGEYTNEQFEKVLNMVSSYGLKDKAIFMSSNKTTLERAAQMDEFIELHYTCNTMTSADIEYIEGLKNGKRVVGLWGSSISSSMASECVEKGVRCVLWYAIGTAESQDAFASLDNNITAVLSNNFNPN